MVLLCEDVNVRKGNLGDTIPDVDKICHRITIDETRNSHGDGFLELLKDSKICVLNERVNSGKDDYTFSLYIGKSVVDYIAVNHNAYSNINYMC